ncbi:hypothetical protein DAPPUDRAFT_238322 [Daphnia pulex]|uniref:Uncharacterized protein n=1 Tax=Daphnia pulex TaxID=6669 RepID=E9G644_DAPPU|nr:hypothetical protein DAPPUDRAFT_238322 [Daphnia pulex]|eukprot:EFX85057.1 hypothetical protein DAPPUDRAFT_238322 [Daphnia pulex]
MLMLVQPPLKKKRRMYSNNALNRWNSTPIENELRGPLPHRAAVNGNSVDFQPRDAFDSVFTNSSTSMQQQLEQKGHDF